MINSSKKTRERERERIKREREETEEPESEEVEPLSFSTLANELGRLGNKPSKGWGCPTGCTSN